MLGKTILTTLFDSNAATNARLRALAVNLNDGQLDAPTTYSRGSLRETLRQEGAHAVWNRREESELFSESAGDVRVDCPKGQPENAPFEWYATPITQRY